MYGPAYQIRPIGGQTNGAYGVMSTNGNGKHLYESSYEDHLEKAARLSAEMNNYNPVGFF